MAKLKNPLASLAASGGLAKTLTFLRRRGQNIVEKTPVPDDPQTLAQLSWRHMYTKAVALWHALSPEEKQDWESQARSRHMTGFAWFISQALKPNPGLYLPLQGGTMQGDIDMASHRILDLIDPTLDQEPVTLKYFEDNLPIGAYTEGARVYHDIDQSIPNNALTIVAFNSERYDTDSIHDNVTNNSRLTCKTAGKYLITTAIELEYDGAGQRMALLGVNGITWIARANAYAVAFEVYRQTVTTIYHLNIDDFAELSIYQGSGGALLLKSSPNYSPEFMMQRIG